MLKLFLIIGPMLNIAIMIIRPFILGTLVFRDPICILLLLASYWIISVVTSLLHRFNGRSKSFPMKTGTLVTYPVYQLWMGCMHLGLATSGCTFGRMKDETFRPSIVTQKELYPCPPHADIDWFTVWRTSDASRLSVLGTEMARSVSGDILSEGTASMV